MGRLPPTRKYRKRKSGRDPVLPPAGKGKLRIKQVRSGNGHSYRMKRTLEALGLKHHQDEVVHADHPALRGMLQQVRHLVEVTPEKEVGKTAGRGGKGQTARQGGHVRPGFEGGQMPLIRRIPKRGFTNPFKQPAQVVNVRHLVLLAEGVEVTPETLFGAGLVRRPDHPIKLLGTGEVAGRKFVVKGVAVSASAKTKIEQAGGTIA